MTHPNHLSHRKLIWAALIAALIGVGGFAGQAAAASYTSTPEFSYGTIAQWGVNGRACIPRAALQASYNIWTNTHSLTASAWYDDCRAANYKGICARIWKGSSIVNGGALCTVPQSGKTDLYASWPPIGCIPGALYKVEMLFLVSSQSGSMSVMSDTSVTC